MFLYTWMAWTSTTNKNKVLPSPVFACFLSKSVFVIFLNRVLSNCIIFLSSKVSTFEMRICWIRTRVCVCARSRVWHRYNSLVNSKLNFTRFTWIRIHTDTVTVYICFVYWRNISVDLVYSSSKENSFELNHNKITEHTTNFTWLWAFSNVTRRWWYDDVHGKKL